MTSAEIVIVAAEVPTPDGPSMVDVVIDDSGIAAVHPTRGRSAYDATVIEAAGAILTPGLVDVHIHGAFGKSFTDNDPGTVEVITRGLAERGITTVQASLVSLPSDELATMITRLAGQLGPQPDRATVSGIHLEGPFLSVAQAGAHDPTALRSPSEDDLRMIFDGDAVTMITLAPELPDVTELIAACARAGIVAAVGHSDGDQADLDAAVAAGAAHITHLWSGQSMVTRRGPWRVPGMLEASLTADLPAEIIADGKHLPPTLLELARRCVGDQLVIVSDATPGAGMPDGYEYPLGSVRCVVSDGVGMVIGQPAFGGSTTLLDDMVRYLVHELRWPLPEVLAMATSTPAAVLGRDDIGVIKVGARADLVLWEPDLSVRQVIIGGSAVTAGR